MQRFLLLTYLMIAAINVNKVSANDGLPYRPFYGSIEQKEEYTIIPSEAIRKRNEEAFDIWWSSESRTSPKWK